MGPRECGTNNPFAPRSSDLGNSGELFSSIATRSKEIEYPEGGADIERNRGIIVTLNAAAHAYNVRLNCLTTAINALNWALGERTDLMPLTPEIEAA